MIPTFGIIKDSDFEIAMYAFRNLILAHGTLIQQHKDIYKKLYEARGEEAPSLSMQKFYDSRLTSHSIGINQGKREPTLSRASSQKQDSNSFWEAFDIRVL